MDWGNIGTLVGLASSVLCVVYTYGILNHRVKMLEKMHDDKMRRDELRDASLSQVLVTLGRLETKLDHMAAKPWWKG